MYKKHYLADDWLDVPAVSQMQHGLQRITWIKRTAQQKNLALACWEKGKNMVPLLDRRRDAEAVSMLICSVAATVSNNAPSSSVVLAETSGCSSFDWVHKGHDCLTADTEHRLMFWVDAVQVQVRVLMRIMSEWGQGRKISRWHFGQPAPSHDLYCNCLCSF